MRLAVAGEFVLNLRPALARIILHGLTATTPCRPPPRNHRHAKHRPLPAPRPSRPCRRWRQSTIRAPPEDTLVEVMRSLIQRHLSRRSRAIPRRPPARDRVGRHGARAARHDPRAHDRHAGGAQRTTSAASIISRRYLMGRLFGNNLIATGLRDTASAALAARGRTLIHSRVRGRHGPGNGGLGASPRASWIRSRRSTIPRSATASTTSSACSSRSSSTATRSSIPTTG